MVIGDRIPRKVPGMSYSDIAGLAGDDEFTRRLAACLAQEAATKPVDDFTTAILRNPRYAASSMFMPFVSPSPGFAEDYAANGQAGIDDSELLSAVQSVWDAVGAIYPVPLA